jgi:hypothetical protein
MPSCVTSPQRAGAGGGGGICDGWGRARTSHSPVPSVVDDVCHFPAIIHPALPSTPPFVVPLASYHRYQLIYPRASVAGVRAVRAIVPCTPPPRRTPAQSLSLHCTGSCPSFVPFANPIVRTHHRIVYARLTPADQAGGGAMNRPIVRDGIALKVTCPCPLHCRACGLGGAVCPMPTHHEA